MTPEIYFHYEIQKPDSGAQVAKFTLHGKAVIETRDQIERMFKENPCKGQVVIDLGDISYVDSAGLGALIRIKMQAASQSGVNVKFVQITPRMMALLKLTNLTDWFTS